MLASLGQLRIARLLGARGRSQCRLLFLQGNCGLAGSGLQLLGFLGSVARRLFESFELIDRRLLRAQFLNLGRKRLKLRPRQTRRGAELLNRLLQLYDFVRAFALRFDNQLGS